jgi:hypothetical protein
MYSNAFIAAFKREVPLPATPWLDCDTTPALRGRYAKRKTPEKFKAEALRLLDDVTEGQIGIYASRFGGDFYGYAIKYAGKPAYFEEPPTDAS